ncbi:MAG: polynucleotide adenylyltransferase PcnB [Burkholderiaceae bacterium]|nr:polynucleotide adenylyltransferase PcnB [Burkholderiaceae bacterium]
MIKKFLDRVLKRAPGLKKPKTASAAELGINPDLISAHAVRVTQVLQEAGFTAYVVGGAVRDLVLGVLPKDFDVATNATPEQVEKLFRRSRIIGRRFRIVHVTMGRETIEVTTFRGMSEQASPKDAHGRVLADNTYGSLESDAQRRDFTVNAFYYDPQAEIILDYCGGLKDLKNKTLRIIGNPEQRFREDPVRMLRVVRFAAKLQFDIEQKTRTAITPLADLLQNVPPARLFDEILKLLLSGYAVTTLKRLRSEGLHAGLLPLLDVVLDDPSGEKFVFAALTNTDQRVKQDKPVTPSFLFAALLWHEVIKKKNKYQAQGEVPYEALAQAMSEVIDIQCESLAIPRRFTADMREIWNMQPRFEKRGKSAFRFVEHPRFRAAFDFYLLRAESNEPDVDTQIAQWWVDFVAAEDSGKREELIRQLTITRNQSASKKKRRRRKAADINKSSILSKEGDVDISTIVPENPKSPLQQGLNPEAKEDSRTCIPPSHLSI